MQSRQVLLFTLSTIMLLTVVSPVSAAGRFRDVPADNVFLADIEWLAAEGITAGCNPPDNTDYCPKDNVTREQMAAFLTRALNLTDNGGGNTFEDDNGSIFEDDIAKLATAGITKGCNPPGNTMFCPKDNVTREQMAAFLHRALDEPPEMVMGLIVTLSGGSGEIDVSWDENPEPDVNRYNVWFSEIPGATKTLVPEPYFFGPDRRSGRRWFMIDWPRAQTVGQSCYQISAVDDAGHDGARSVEECFDPVPGAPAAVSTVVVTLGGGSTEVEVSWGPNSESDVSHYNAYFSELPGGPYTFVPEPYPGGSGTKPNSRIFFIDFPRDQTVGKTCYVISAVDLNEKEGPTSTEACFTP